jgi:hypothetical protein
MTLPYPYKLSLALLSPQFESDNGNNDKKDGQDDGDLEQGFFHASAGPVDCIRLSEDTSQSSTLDLEENRKNKTYRDNDHSDAEVY